MALMILLEAEDPQGNKAKIEVTEFKSLTEAVKLIAELQKEIQELKQQLSELTNGTSN